MQYPKSSLALIKKVFFQDLKLFDEKKCRGGNGRTHDPRGLTLADPVGVHIQIRDEQTPSIFDEDLSEDS